MARLLDISVLTSFVKYTPNHRKVSEMECGPSDGLMALASHLALTPALGNINLDHSQSQRARTQAHAVDAFFSHSLSQTPHFVGQHFLQFQGQHQGQGHQPQQLHQLHHQGQSHNHHQHQFQNHVQNQHHLSTIHANGHSEWAREFSTNTPNTMAIADSNSNLTEFSQSSHLISPLHNPHVMHHHQDFLRSPAQCLINSHQPSQALQPFQPEIESAFFREFAAVKHSLGSTNEVSSSGIKEAQSTNAERHHPTIKDEVDILHWQQQYEEAYTETLKTDPNQTSVGNSDLTGASLNGLESRFENLWADADASQSNLTDLFESTWKDVQLQNKGGEDFSMDFGTEPANATALDPVLAPAPPFTFTVVNPFLAHPDALQMGQQLMARGQLGQAALALEAAVQSFQASKDAPAEAEAWINLGCALAEDEKDQEAISALTHGVKIDPRNLRGLMALSVALTNESHTLQAYLTLERYILTSHPDLQPSIPVPNRISSYALHERVSEIYLKCVRASNKVDPDIQMGLGVLFYLAGEYDKSIDCFETVVRIRPDDYLAWNRLGATMANSGQCTCSFPWFMILMQTDIFFKVNKPLRHTILPCPSGRHSFEACTTSQYLASKSDAIAKPQSIY